MQIMGSRPLKVLHAHSDEGLGVKRSIFLDARLIAGLRVAKTPNPDCEGMGISFERDAAAAVRRQASLEGKSVFVCL